MKPHRWYRLRSSIPAPGIASSRSMPTPQYSRSSSGSYEPGIQLDPPPNFQLSPFQVSLPGSYDPELDRGSSRTPSSAAAISRAHRYWSRTRSSPALPAATPPIGATSTPSTPKPGVTLGASGRSPHPVSPATIPGKAIAGSSAAVRAGSPAPTTPNWTCFTGASATRRRTSTAIRARATTSTPTRSSLSIPTPASSSGTTRKCPTTSGTGTAPTKSS